MGRPSKLTEKQWEEVKSRKLAGESWGALSKEFGVSKAAMIQRLGDELVTIKDVANQIVTAQDNLRKLPVADQLRALTMADELREILTHSMGSARLNAASAHRLAGLANDQLQYVSDAGPMSEESIERLKTVAVLGKMSNEFSAQPNAILGMAKEQVQRLGDAEQSHSAKTMHTMTDDDLFAIAAGRSG